MPNPDQIIHVEVDSDGLNRVLGDLREALLGQGKDVSTILVSEHRALIRTICNFTPPMPRSQAKQRGEAAVIMDIRSLIKEAGPQFLDEIGSEYGLKDINAHRTRKDGTELHLLWDNIILNPANIPDVHNRYRNRRGRIPKENNFGQGVWNARIVVEKGQRSAYIKQVQSHVGRWKARWAYCGAKLGDNRYPNWITRHFGYVSGNATLQSQLNGDAGEMFIQSGGRGPNFAENTDKIYSAMTMRVNAIKRRIKLIVSGYAKDVAQGLKVRAKARIEDAQMEEVD